MNKSDLPEALREATGLKTGKAEGVVKTVFNTMANALKDGDRVEIRGLGSFKVKPKKLAFFKCGKDLKEVVDT